MQQLVKNMKEKYNAYMTRKAQEKAIRKYYDMTPSEINTKIKDLESQLKPGLTQMQNIRIRGQIRELQGHPKYKKNGQFGGARKTRRVRRARRTHKRRG